MLNSSVRNKGFIRESLELIKSKMQKTWIITYGSQRKVKWSLKI